MSVKMLDCPLPWSGPVNLDRFKALRRFLSACQCVREKHRAARWHQELTQARAQDGLAEEPWLAFMARLYFSKTFRVERNKLSWRQTP